MPAEDEDLLARLGQALRPPEAEPSQAEIAALHRAVRERAVGQRTVGQRADGGRADGHGTGGKRAGTGGTEAPAARRVWPRRATAAAAAAAVLVVIVSGLPVPRPVRAAAHAIGLPVDSVEVADAKSAMSDLQRALDDGDQEGAARASARLRQRLDALGEKDRQRIGTRAEPLLQRAGAPPVPPPGTPPPGATVRPTASTTTSTTTVRSTTTSSTTSTTARTPTTRSSTSTTR